MKYKIKNKTEVWIKVGNVKFAPKEIRIVELDEEPYSSFIEWEPIKIKKRKKD